MMEGLYLFLISIFALSSTGKFWESYIRHAIYRFGSVHASTKSIICAEIDFNVHNDRAITQVLQTFCSCPFAVRCLILFIRLFP